jgi:diguanylate cyclase (GGDEF)-like protein
MSAIIEPLTGLMQAQSFISQLEAAVRQGERMVLVVMDLDHLHSINQDYGHVAGDEWIKANAQRFAQAFNGTNNLVGRYGGDEFLAAVHGMDLAQVVQKAEALRASIQNDSPQISVNGQTIQPGKTISLGLSAFPEHAVDVNDLIDRSLTALRRAKISGGNQVVLYQEIDLLTGVLSKLAIERALEEAVANRKNEPVSVFVLDIDHFKEINDDHGHRAGDEVLKRMGHILLTNFKEIGKVGRISGDEFIVILPGQRTDSAFILADEVRRLVEDSEIQASLSGHNYSLRFRISGGIASVPGDGAEAVELRGKAEEALYRSKQTGRNRISLPASAQMVTKTSYYTQAQLERLSKLARSIDKTEAFLLREALDDLLLKYKE